MIVSPPNALAPIANPLSDWDDLPTSHTIIGYGNYAVTGASVNSSRSLLPNTYERWLAQVSGTMLSRFQLAQSSTIDYVAIAAHNLFSEGATNLELAVTNTIGGTLTTILDVPITSDDPIMVTFEPELNVAEIRVAFINGTNDREVGVVQVGQKLQMYQPIYGGHSPINLSARTSYQSNNSESGQFLGRTVIRRGLETSYSYRHLDPDWLRVKFLPFMEHAKTLPFFIKWRPDLYETTAYGYTTADIQPVNMGGGHRLMSVNFNVKAHSDI